MSVSRQRKSKNGGVHRNANVTEIGLQQHILLTKLQRPSVASDILPRARLLDRLNEGRQRTLTLISAPAGYGKSTLASRWVAACDSPSGWVSLDERDSDLRTFLSYVLAAVRSLFPKTELRTEALLEASQLPSVSLLSRHLLNDFHQVTEPFILVLDDYHRIREKPVHDLATEILTHPPQAMHLVLLTRRDPPLPISRLRGRGQVSEIRAADLHFTPAEAKGFLSKMLKVPVDDATAELLEKRTEGWVTGLRLAGLYLRGQVDLKRRVQELSGSFQHIAEYLAAEVLSRQKPEIVDYLLDTSILDRFCAPLCQRLHAGSTEVRNEERHLDAQKFIEWLVEANIFVIPLDHQGYWFRYHHLFQGFLKNLLRKQKKAGTIAELHKRAYEWFAENDLIDEGIKHALAARDTEAAVRLVIEHRYELMNTSQFILLNRCLEMLPKETIPDTPLLLSALAYIGIEQGQDSDVYYYTSQADRMLSQLPPAASEYAVLKSEVCVIKGFIDMAWGHPERGITYAEEALHSLSANALLIRSLGIFTLAVCHQMQGNPGQAAKSIREASLDPAWPDNIRARLHFYLSLTHYMDANLDGAMSSSLDCLRILKDLPFTHTRTFAFYLLGACHYLRNETAEAESHLQSVMDDYLASNPSYVANAAFILACIYLARDGAGQAGQVLNQVATHFQEIGHRVALALVQAFEAELSLRQGDINRARRVSNNVDFGMRPPIWFYHVPQLTPVKLLLAEGTDESLRKARTRLAALDGQMNRINRKNVRIDILALLALVCHKSGEEAAALEHLKYALDLAEPGGWIRNFVDLGALMTNLLERLNQLQPGLCFAQLVLEACRAEARSSPSSSPSKQAMDSFLTKREIELLPLLAEGLSNEQIAAKLFIATGTVKKHLQNIYFKLNARGRIEALKKVRKLNLVING